MPPGADPTGPCCPAGDPRGFATKFYTSQGNWDLVRLGRSAPAQCHVTTRGNIAVRAVL